MLLPRRRYHVALNAHSGTESLLRRELWFGQTSKHHREPATFTEFFQVTVTEPSVGRMAFFLSGLLPLPAACQPASASAPTGAELALGPSFLPFRQSLSWARDRGRLSVGGTRGLAYGVVGHRLSVAVHCGMKLTQERRRGSGEMMLRGCYCPLELPPERE